MARHKTSLDAQNVLFLDLDGVLNSTASFRLNERKGMNGMHEALSETSCSNLQHVLDLVPSLRMVISSTWRLYYSMTDICRMLEERYIDAKRVIDKTPATMSGPRGHEISLWLKDYPKIKRFVVVDDDAEAHVFAADRRCLSIKTNHHDGLLFSQAEEIIKFLS